MFEQNRWVYYLALILCGLCALIINQRNVNYSILDDKSQKQRQKIVYILTFVMFAYITFWAAIRNGVADTAAYINNYKALSTDISIKELFFSDKDASGDKAPLFVLYQLVLKRLGFRWQFYLASIAIVSGFCIYKGISRYSDDVIISYYIFITGLYYTWLFNGMRQFLVAAILFANFKWVVEKKLWKVLLLVFVLYFVHKTAWTFIPVYFIANMKNWSYGIYACILATMAVVILFPNQFTALLDSSFEEYDVAEQFAEDDGVNILRFLVSMVTPVLAFVYKDKIAEFNSPDINVLVNMSLITGGLYAVGVVTSGIYMGRLPLYTDIFGLILFPFILKRVLPKQTKGPIFATSLIFYGVYFYLQTRDSYYTTNWFASMDLGGAQL
ncbi:MAG: EpsG family protein [Clostridia bacterium]|nr:EpsG family protein [Clostridia bacterium]